MPPELISFAKHVDSLLKDYSSRAGEGLIEIERIDPAPDSEGESRAKINNLQEISGRSNEPAYLGLTVTCLDRKSTIPFFHPRIHYPKKVGAKNPKNPKKATVILTRLTGAGVS